MPVKLTQVQRRRHAGGKDVLTMFLFCWQHDVRTCRSSIAGSISGYVAGSSAAYMYENQA